MKKVIPVVVSVLLMVSLLAGCVVKPIVPVASVDPGVTKAPAGDKPASGDKASAPAMSFNKYVEAKGKAFERVSAKISENEELVFYGFTLLPFTMLDLTLLPLSALVGDETTNAAALSLLSISGLKVERSGDTYTLTYSNNEGKKYVQTCSYDAATDSMQSSITDDAGKESMFFEYVRVGNCYAAQYYSVEEDGTKVFTAFFNDTDLAAFGMKDTQEKPASIFKNGSVTVDIVKGTDTYMILEGDKLTVHDKGEDKIYE